MTAERTSTSAATAAGPASVPDLEDLDVEDLLARVTRGDHGAFGRLCAAVSDPVYGLVLSVLADPTEAEEVTGRVLVEVWRTAPRYEPGQATATGWLMTLAHRHAVNRVRATNPAHTASTRHRHGLGALSGIERETVALAYHDGHTYPQIAARLGTTPAAVTTTIHQALIRLRDHPEPATATITATPQQRRRTGG